ncbi:MAG: hypothetical protein MUO26_06170 [Methanotrichaceae archaeon]|nr:hypothetical protein [Methanotrichaceae archaeon]
MKAFILLSISILILMDLVLCGVSPTYDSATSNIAMNPYPSGAPTPPDPNTEQLVLPDFNLLKPSNIQMPLSSQSMIGDYPGLYPAQSAAISSACPSCRGQSLPGCCGSFSQGGFIGQGCQAVFPQPSVYRSNSYYVQICPGKLCSEAGVRCGEWLPLWSNIGRVGTYWSYEWTQCGSSYCYPEVRNFGYKGAGWYQTWFNSNKPGWHILSYWCSDWSNYIYIYVWPTT